MSDGSGVVMVATLIALATGLAFIAGCAIHYGRQITSRRVPMQWGLNGAPTWFAPRVVGIWFAFGFTALVSAGLLIAAQYEPQKLAGLIFALVIVTGTNMWMQAVHLKRVIRWQQQAPAG